MPIYEYELVEGECHICDGRFELNRPISRPDLDKCPLCRKPVCKVISRTSSPKVSKAPSLTDAKKAGFTVLERRDKGVYERL